MSNDYTRGDSPVYDGCRESWATQRENELLERIDELESELAQRQEPDSKTPTRKTCEYLQDDSYHEETFTCSECGNKWTFFCGNPFENGVQFCVACGSEVAAVVLHETDEERSHVMRRITREEANKSDQPQ